MDRQIEKPHPGFDNVCQTTGWEPVGAGGCPRAATEASTRELMARMGHSTPDAALRYQHATEDRDRVIAEALASLTKPAPVGAIERAMGGASPAGSDSGQLLR